MKHFFLLVLFLFSLKAEYCVELNDIQKSYPIKEGVLYLEDKNASHHISDIIEMQDKFQVSLTPDLNFGFTASTYWFKIPIKYFQYNDNVQTQWWIDIDYALLNKVSVYQEIEGDIKLLMQTGDGTKFSSREVKWRSFSAILDTSKASTIYVRVQTQSAMQVPMKIYSSLGIAQAKQTQTLFYGFFYGALFVIIFYNIFLFFVWNDKNYLYYVFFISSFVLWQLSVDGFGYQYLWPNLQSVADKGSLVFIGMTIFASLLFTRSFLHLKEYAQSLNKLVLALQGVTGILLLGSFFFSYAVMIKLLIAMIFIVPLVLLYAGIVALKNKYRYARFYIVGWSVFLGASVVFAMNKLGLIGGYEYIKYFQQVGSLAEVSFFSLALAERINVLRQQNLKTLSRLNAHLQTEVHEKVSQIREKDALLIQQSRLASMGEMLENIAHQWKQPLHKLSLVIQNHYFRHKLGENVLPEEMEKFNEQSAEIIEYMSNTVDDFRNFFSPEKEIEAFKLSDSLSKVLSLSTSQIKEYSININVDDKSLAMVYGYPNEFSQVLLNLLANARDAFENKKTKKRIIEVFIFEQDKNVVLEFLDNAGGIPYDVLPRVFDPYFTTKGLKEGSGIGLYMSKMIIENSMNGEFLVENRDNGACFSIILPKVL